MPADMFLKLEGIKGESNDDKHPDEIEILSYSWGASQMGTFAGGSGGGAGKVAYQDFHFTKVLDKATPELLKRCSNGHHIPKATLVVRKAGGKQQEYHKVVFSDCLVSSFQAAGSGSDIVNESISLNFAKIEFEYKPQKKDGELDAAVIMSHDLKKMVTT